VGVGVGGFDGFWGMREIGRRKDWAFGVWRLAFGVWRLVYPGYGLVPGGSSQGKQASMAEHEQFGELSGCKTRQSILGQCEGIRGSFMMQSRNVKNLPFQSMPALLLRASRDHASIPIPYAICYAPRNACKTARTDCEIHRQILSRAR
jgi:hypothetical protein